MKVGAEWIIDAEGGEAEKLSDASVLRRICLEVIADLDLRVVGEAAWHQFAPPGGVTGLFLLTESHLACHTYPEFGIATFNLYCCRPRSRWPWEEHLRLALGATRVSVRLVERGAKETRIVPVDPLRLSEGVSNGEPC